MLETVRQYGLETLADAGEEEALRGRHRDFYLALAEHAASELEMGRQPDLVAALDPEAANLAAAIDHALGSTPPLAVRLCAAVYRYWASRRRFTESELAFSRWLEAGGARDSALSARALRGRAYLAIQAGKYEAAEAHATGCPRPRAGRSSVLAWDDDDRHG